MKFDEQVKIPYKRSCEITDNGKSLGQCTLEKNCGWEAFEYEGQKSIVMWAGEWYEHDCHYEADDEDVLDYVG